MAFDDLSDAQLDLVTKLAQKLATGKYKQEFRVLTQLMSAGPEIHLTCIETEAVEPPIKHFRESSLNELKEKDYITLTPEGQPRSRRFIGSLTTKAYQQYDLLTCSPGSSSGTITWLHISDLHAGKPGMGWDAHRVIEKLVDDMRRMESDHGLHPDFIFFTGDAAFGQIGSSPSETLAGQYELAQEFFDSVRQAFSPEVPLSNLFLVPGNHDVNRQLVRSHQTEWLDQQEDPYKICGVLEKGGRRWRRYKKRLTEYRKSLEVNGYSHLLDHPDHLIYAAVREVEGVRVGIGGFNSAWSCCRDSKTEKGKLWMGSRWQLEQIRSKIKGADITIALFHHPASWLVEAEDGKFWHGLERDFKFALHGHEHRGWVTTGADGWTRIAAGACYNRSDKENGYNLVQLDLETGEGQVWLRRYDDTGGGWIPHVVHGQTTDQGIWELKHLNWLKPEPGSSTEGDVQAPQPYRREAPMGWLASSSRLIRPRVTNCLHRARLTDELASVLAERSVFLHADAGYGKIYLAPLSRPRNGQNKRNF